MNGPLGKKTLYAFRESKLFTKQLDSVTSLETLYAIQRDLEDNPEKWPVIKGTGGARKGRIADPNDDRGKSGSYRYIYYYYEFEGRVYLLYLYEKKKQSDLIPSQKKMIEQVVSGIKSNRR